MKCKQNIIKVISLCLCCFISMGSIASPTSSDFKRCVLLKAKVLEYCLKKKKNKNCDIDVNNHCQEKSNKAYKSCHKEVMKRFTPMSKAEQEALRERKALIKQAKLEKKLKHTDNK